MAESKEQIHARLNASHYKVTVFLGKVCLIFGHLENMLQSVVNGLISGDQHLSMTVTSELSFRARLDLLNSLVSYKSANLPVTKKTLILDGLATVSRLLTDAEQERNICIHSVWGFGGAKSNAIQRHKFTCKRKHGLRGRWEFLSEAQLEEIADKCQKALDGITKYSELLDVEKLPFPITTGIISASLDMPKAIYDKP